MTFKIQIDLLIYVKKLLQSKLHLILNTYFLQMHSYTIEINVKTPNLINGFSTIIVYT
jgi:hypothetical protein